MARPKFKQRCAMCKNNMVLMFSQRQFPICVDCHMKQVDVEIKDPKMKKFFDIPRKLYLESSFLRNIKQSYLRYDRLSDRQSEVFLKVVREMKAEMKGGKKDKEKVKEASNKDKKESVDGKKTKNKSKK